MGPHKKLLLFLLIVMVLSACGSPTNEPELSDELVDTDTAGTSQQPTDEDSSTGMSPCEVTNQMIGQALEITGTIEFVDHGDPNGLFVGISERGCMLGVFIDMAVFDQWDESRQAAIGEGSQVTLRGTLTSFDGELVMEVYAQQEEVVGVQAEDVGEIANFSIQVTDDPDSRWQEVTIIALDSDGQPVSGVPISITQSDIDFIHSSSNTVWASWLTEEGVWSDDAEEQMQRYRDMGTNNWEFLPWWSWSLYEPADDQWEFYSYTNDWHFTDRPYWQEFFPDARFNTMWVGPQFDREYMIPSWVDYQNDDAFRAEFGEFIREAFDLNPTGHFDLYGVTVEINDAPTWGRAGWDITDQEWDWAIDFIAWEVDLIRSLDPDARISIDFDPIPYFDDCEPCRIENWIERIIAAGVEFDVIGLELHPGAFAGSPATVEELDALIQSLDVFGKDYYVWEFGVRSHGEPTQSVFLGELSSPPVLEYNEDYQGQTYVDFLRYFIDNPRFLGVRYLKYVDGLTADEEAHALPDNQVVIRTVGLLRADRTPKPAYFAIRDYFHSLYFTGEGQTDELGRFTFTAIPGIFEFVIAGEGEQIHLWAGMDSSLME